MNETLKKEIEENLKLLKLNGIEFPNPLEDEEQQRKLGSLLYFWRRNKCRDVGQGPWYITRVEDEFFGIEYCHEGEAGSEFYTIWRGAKKFLLDVS